MDKIKNNLKLQLNSIQKVENDPTLKKCTFSIIDFEESGNSQIISKELAQKYAYTLKNKALLCQYFKTTDFENQNDHFGDHGQYVGKDRYGNDTLKTDAIAVGCFEGEAYIKTVKDDNGFDKEALCCDAVLWYSRYSDVIDLMEEMVNENIDLYSSCEYWFYNYTVTNGIQYVNEPIYFDGHCMLQSGENGTKAIPPAYKISKLQSFNKALEKIINEEDEQGGEEMTGKKKEEKSVNEEIVIEQPVVENNEPVVEPVVEQTQEEEVVEVVVDEEKENLIKENSEKDETILKLTEEIEALKVEKATMSTKHEEVTEKIVSLNETVNRMKPIVEAYEKEQLEKSLNEAKEKYQVKFDKIGASEKFNTVEVQELVKKSLNSLEAKNQLNDMIVDMVDNVNVTVKPIVEMAKSQNKLIPTESSFEDRFGFKL